jgi:CheY-like chemotaxis protein/HPt (histidine-containing phosphotransfer) domain-containing protein
MAATLSSAIEAIWETSREEIGRRIATLEHAVAAMLGGDLGVDLRDRAHSDAHKLAGSLGMFGFATGSALAQELEQALATDGAPELEDVPHLAELVGVLRGEFDARMAGDHREDADDQRVPAPECRAHEILVIDDSPVICRVVEVGLGGDRAWRVRAASSGAEGIVLASRECPDVILLDVEMPDLDGPDTLARLRAQETTRQIPVLFLTCHSSDEWRRELRALGAAGVIAKPFDPATLAAEIAGLLGWAR